MRSASRHDAPPAAAPRPRGYTLVEIMIAMLVGLTLSAGMVQVFRGSRQSYRVQDGLGRLQENARFAMNFLAREIRMAGFTGCYRGPPSAIENVLNNPGAFTWDASDMITGSEWNGSGWTPPLDASLNGKVKDGTDVIVVRRMDDRGAGLAAPFSDPARLFIDPADNAFTAGEVLMVTDCRTGSVFQTTDLPLFAGRINIMHSSAAGFAPGNRKPRLAKRYGQGAEVAKLDATAFFIGTGGGDEPSLYQRTLATQGGTAATMSNHALVEGVEDMQVLYGVDTDHDGSVNAYLSAAASDMSKVVSVHISLLLRTAADYLAAAPQSLRYNGGVFNAPDRRLRRVANTTIKLRNRGAR